MIDVARFKLVLDIIPRLADPARFGGRQGKPGVYRVRRQDPRETMN